MYALLIPIQLLYSHYKHKDTLTSYFQRITRLASSLDTIRHSITTSTTTSLIYWRLFLLVAALTLVFTSAAYAWYISISRIPVSAVTAIYNTSCFFAYLLSIWMLPDEEAGGHGGKVRLSKVAAVLMSVCGIAVITFLNPNGAEDSVGSGSDNNGGEEGSVRDLSASWLHAVSQSSPTISSAAVGYLSALLSSIFVALYEVLYKSHLVPAFPHTPSTFLSLHITGLIGIATLTFGIIPLPLLHLSGFETFRFPTLEEFKGVVVIGVLGVVYNACFMLVIALSGPVVAAVGIMMSIPVTTLVDVAVKGTGVGLNTVVGAMMIFAAYAVLNSNINGGKQLDADVGGSEGENGMGDGVVGEDGRVQALGASSPLSSPSRTVVNERTRLLS
ncbi:hypothetical protein HK102_002656 [Quaeritorhiza haematococci]|nr:hypothetical protein HK102_002656 [Quaeritorhiza haematococci]